MRTFAHFYVLFPTGNVGRVPRRHNGAVEEHDILGVIDRRNSQTSWRLLRGTRSAADVGQQRILGRFAANVQVGAVRIDEAGGLHPLAHATLVVVDRREVTRRSAPRPGTSASASPRRFRQRSNSESACGNASGVQIRATQIEVADPGIQQRVRFGQELDRLPRVAAVQRESAFEDLGVGLRLGLEFRRRGSAMSVRRASTVAGLDEDTRRPGTESSPPCCSPAPSRRQPSRPAVRPAATAAHARRPRTSPRRVSRFFAARSAGGASLEDPHRLGESSLMQRRDRQGPRPRTRHPARRSSPSSGRSASRRRAGPGPTARTRAQAARTRSGPVPNRRFSSSGRLEIAGVVRVQREVVAEQRARWAAESTTRCISSTAPSNIAELGRGTAPAGCGRGRRRHNARSARRIP